MAPTVRAHVGLAVVFTLASIGALALVGPANAQSGAGPALEPTAYSDVREVLGRALVAARELTFDARMVIVTMSPDGPSVTELEVRQGADGHLQVASAESWLLDVAEPAVVAYLGEAGPPLLLGNVRALPFSLAEVLANYAVEVDGRAVIDTGSSLVLGFRRDAGLRERLYADEATGLVVRRETYDVDGSIARVVALTDLVVVAPRMVSMPEGYRISVGAVVVDALGQRTQLGPDEVADADGLDWVVPTSLPHGFAYRAGYAVGTGDAIQVVYSDGLYTLSLLEQLGRLDHRALHGAVMVEHDGRAIYRWPGSEPERLVWSGGGRTFTAVSDAPTNVVMQAVAALPHEARQGLLQRVGSGAQRMASWIWPFG